MILAIYINGQDTNNYKKSIGKLRSSVWLGKNKEKIKNIENHNSH